MAPRPKSGVNNSSLKKNRSVFLNVQRLWKKYFRKEVFYKLAFDPSMIWLAAFCLLLAELCVNVIVIWKIPYTEIDWVAYMQEVEGVVNGTFDYTKLQGDTGPLVYPAGFVYIYLALYYVTSHGQNIRLAQYIFAVFYLLTLAAVFRIYQKSKKIPPYALIFMCCTSYRIHSIFILRLFNDPVAMLLFYLSVNLIISNKWTWGCALFSIAVSVKMNVLLFAPGLFILLWATQGLWKTFYNLVLCGLIQLILALPFLLANPVGYISRAFDLGRVFLFEWTVNWRFLPEDIFLNRYFHLLLLLLHAAVLLIFLVTHWWSYIKLKWQHKGLLVFSVNYYPKYVFAQITIAISHFCMSAIHFTFNLASLKSLTVDLPLILPLFTANFIGVAFSRSLHYQFYIWYYHSLPYLLWSTPFPVLFKIGLLGVIELAWNTYPSTIWSSASLHICHLLILVAIWRSTPTPQSLKVKKSQ